MNSGSITIGGGTFNTGSSYNVLYVGASKTSGLELNSSSVQNLYIRMTDNSQTLTLAANLVVNGNLQMSAGIFDITARQLTLAGDLKMNSGSMFTSSSTSNMSLTGTASLTNGLAFTSGSALGDLTISLTNNGKAKLMTALAISGHLKLMNGSFSLESGSTLTMNAASTIHVEGGSMAVNSGTFVGTAAYNVEYMGGSNTSGTELTGSGLSNLSISLVGPSNSVKLKNSITVAGKLNLTSGKLDLNGDTLTVNGTMWQSSAAPFIGSTSSSLVLNLTSATDDTLYFDNSNQNLKRLKLNLTGGNIVLGTMLIINSEIDFVKGKLVLINSDLQVLAAALINGYDNAKYIATTGAGRLQMAVNSGSAFVTFPVGTLSDYSPAGIQQTASGATGNFMVRVMSGVLTNGTSGYNTANSASVVDRTWLIDAASGLNVNMNLKLAWVGAAEVNSFDRTHAYISHYKNSVWDTYTIASASAGVNSTYELTRNGISSLSPFAVSDNNAAMGITENVNAVTSVEMYPNPSTDYLNIQIINSGGANYLYEIIDVTGRTVLTTANNNSLNRLSVSGFTTGCYFIKVTNLDTHSIITKRFIKS
jgi:hypothetical protein